MGAGPLWIRIPRLPLQFWLDDVFRCIGDNLGIYLDHDRSYMETDSLAIARILVHLDTREGLVDSLRLQFQDIIRWQTIDYEGIPFQCIRCHKMEHLYKDCLFITNVHIETPRRLVTIST